MYVAADTKREGSKRTDEFFPEVSKRFISIVPMIVTANISKAKKYAEIRIEPTTTTPKIKP